MNQSKPHSGSLMRLRLLGAIVLAGLTSQASADTIKKRIKDKPNRDLYLESFSKSDAGKPAPEVVDDAEVISSKAISTTLGEQSSFPARVRGGNPEDRFNWNTAPADTMPPKVAPKSFKTQNCSFNLQLGDVSLRIYRPDATRKSVELINDNVLPSATIELVEGATKDDPSYAYLSMYAELKVTTAAGQEASCRKVFSGKPAPLGLASFEGSTLTLVGTKDGVSRTYLERPGVKLFVKWDADFKSLMVINQNGLIPSLESDVYAISPGGAEGFFLLKPDVKWSVKKAGS